MFKDVLQHLQPVILRLPLAMTPSVSRDCQMPQEGQNCPQPRTTAFHLGFLGGLSPSVLQKGHVTRSLVENSPPDAQP